MGMIFICPNCDNVLDWNGNYVSVVDNPVSNGVLHHVYECDKCGYKSHSNYRTRIGNLTYWDDKRYRKNEAGNYVEVPWSEGIIQ